MEAGIATPRMKEVGVLLLPDDEQEVVRAVLREFPQVVFLDERRWEDPDVPPVRASVVDCGRIAGIWNREIYPRIRGHRRASGTVDGPEAEVVQWLRSLERSPGTLHHGRWAYSIPASADPAMLGFVDRIWRILFKLTTNRMRRASARNPNAAERDFRVGAEAFRRAADGSLTLAADALRLAPEEGFVWPKP
jgi:hypothetical protein